ncbi:MFS transporter [Thermomonospora umbrina]|uniref:EmrB/QacA subfamily drug resistance transporter n=1 Tax=Thermomonospora umbrina TaxID=111806 RepID=A0A3D9SQW2_9ACTN|nr:MFS transporter [Thermomonospora umbrina]REE96353.1 EmrB/QacA subfamily drug resistance transporter [Thermomonospora umbrina]
MGARADTAAAGGAERRDVPHRGGLYAIIGALMLGMLLAALDQTIVATALPTIVSDLRGADHLSWVVTAYLLAATAATPLWGKLGDQFGRKHLFQFAIVIFLVGSALCGLAQNMTELIAFRAVQGVGGGGLMALAMAIVGDVVPPRERGRYQGFFGAVFGVSSVLGPLLGGFFVDHLDWRWVFYINLPLGAVALVVVAVVLHARERHERHRVDYAGIVLLGVATVCLVLVATWGGNQYPWGSPVILGLVAAAVAAGVGWYLAERRAPEPVLPLELFTREVFVMSSAVGFVVGFAMFGALTYLPLYLQVVHGISPTMSGVHLLPMVLGMLFTSILSGQLISRVGRYKVYPIAGMAITTFALWLLSRMDVHTASLTMNLYFLVLGLGLGLVMQVIVIAAQNAVPYRDLGAATSGVTYFRSIGGSFGVAVFGSIFTARLGENLSQISRSGLPAGFDPAAAGNDPHLIERLPPRLRAEFLGAYGDAIQQVFLWAIPMGALGFVLALFLREVPLRGTSKAGPDLGEGWGGAPTVRSSRHEVEGRLSRLMMRDASAREMYARLGVVSGVHLPAGSMWALCRIAEEGDVSGTELAERAGVEPARGRPFVDRLVRAGYVVRADGRLRITDTGRSTAERLFAARREGLAEHLEGWSPEDHAELSALLAELSRTSLEAPAEVRGSTAAR